MMDQTEYKLLKRIAQGESQLLDFKFAVNDSRKIARSMAAFSNTDGGSLLIGVKDNGHLAGIRSDEELYMAEAAATMYCRPEIDFNSVLYRIQNKDILEIIIPARPDILTFAPDEQQQWIAWIRHFDTNHPAGSIYESVWARRRSSEGLNLRPDEYHKAVMELMLMKGEVSLSKIENDLGLQKEQTKTILEELILMHLADFRPGPNGMMYILKSEDPG